MFYDFITNYTDIFVEKCEKLLQCKSFYHFFKNKNIDDFQILMFEILTKRSLTTSLVLNNWALINSLGEEGAALYALFSVRVCLSFFSSSWCLGRLNGWMDGWMTCDFSTLPEIAKFSTKYFTLSKVYTDIHVV